MSKQYLISATDTAKCAVYYIAGNTQPKRMVRTAFSLATRFESRKEAQKTLEAASLHWLGLKSWRLIAVTEPFCGKVTDASDLRTEAEIASGERRYRESVLGE